MTCIVCGREMLDRETHYECSNILCDYEEEICGKELLQVLKRNLLSIIVNGSVISFH